MAGFEYRGQLNGADNPVTIDVVIKNSATVKVGDAVYNDTNGLTRATNSTPILGIVAAITNADGIDLDNAPTSTYDGTWTSSSQTYVASADNITDKKVVAKVIADPFALFYNDGDGDMTINDVGTHMKLADQDQVTVGSPSATVGQMQLIKWDPDGDANASKGIFKISFSQAFAYEVET